MKLPLSTTCVLVGLIGLAIGIIWTLGNLKKKAQLANLIFNTKSAFLEDWYVPAVNLLLILAAWIALPYRSGKLAEYADLYVIGFFGLLGIGGNLLLSKWFSSVNKRFDAAIDFKTNEADKAAGTLGTPTPAEKPVKTQ